MISLRMCVVMVPLLLANGCAAPRGQTVTQLTEAVSKIMSSPELVQRWASMNLRFTSMSPQAFAHLIAADDVRYSKIIRERNIRVE